MSEVYDQEELVERWRVQIGQRRPYRRRRPLAALGYLRRGPARESSFFELRQLMLVALHDDPIGRRVPALRLVGYGATQIDHGVAWTECKFFKDLRIEPEYGASGLQLDSSQTELLHLALQLRSALYRCDRYYPKAARRQPQLPRLWAGFATTDAASLAGDGPEFFALCEKFNLAPDIMFRKFERDHGGLRCYPLEWVSESLRRALTIFVDLEGMPNLQVFQVRSLPEDLCGFQNATAFNFYESRQRDYYAERLKRIQHRVIAQAGRTAVACT